MNSSVVLASSAAGRWGDSLVSACSFFKTRLVAQVEQCPSSKSDQSGGMILKEECSLYVPLVYHSSAERVKNKSEITDHLEATQVIGVHYSHEAIKLFAV